MYHFKYLLEMPWSANPGFVVVPLSRLAASVADSCSGSAMVVLTKSSRAWIITTVFDTTSRSRHSNRQSESTEQRISYNIDIHHTKSIQDPRPMDERRTLASHATPQFPYLLSSLAFRRLKDTA